MRTIRVVLLVLFLAGMPAPSAVAGDVDPADDLINELMCPASGYPRRLATSDTAEAAWTREFIRAKTAQGWSRQRIVNTLVRQYGERILPAPTKEGFSLAAWVTPFAAILGGAWLVALLLARWLRERRRHDAYLVAETIGAIDDTELERYEAQLARELEEF